MRLFGLFGLVMLGCLLAGVAQAQLALREQESVEIKQILDSIVSGQDSLFGQAVAPAISIDAQATPAAALKVNARIVQEIDMVLSAFIDAPDGQKIAATRAAVAKLDKETATEGASRTFEGKGPSLSIMRQLAFIPSDEVHGGDPVTRLNDVISSFERSPKTDDDYFEYSNPRDLIGSAIVKLSGSAISWTTGARPSMARGTFYTLKKCRNIILLGWYCNTADYAIHDVASNPIGKASILVTVLRPMPAGQDNPVFSGGQAQNIVDGYTALYLVELAGDLALIYNLGVQYKKGPPNYTSQLNAGQKAEYHQLLLRLQADLGVTAFP